MKIVIYILVLVSALVAQNIQLTQEQLDNWQLHVSKTEKVQEQFLDEIVGMLEVPTKLIYAISIPYDVKIQRILVNRFENIKQGEPMALVGGNSWLQMQQNLINHSISLHEVTLEHERKTLLCNEGIIPAKECIRSKSSYGSKLAQFQSAKSMLFLFGVDEKLIDKIEKTKTIQRNFEVRAPISGLISKMDIQVGQSVNASQPLFTILKKGNLWLSANIAQDKAEQLKLNQKVTLKHRDKKIKSSVVSLAPIVDAKTQTVPVRFMIPESASLNIGLKSTFRLNIDKPSVKIPKVWTVMRGNDVIVFVKNTKGFETKIVKVESEDTDFYYTNDFSLLNDKIANSGIAALKGMLTEGSDD